MTDPVYKREKVLRLVDEHENPLFKREKNWFYFIDEDCDISRVLQNRGRRAKNPTRKFGDN